MSGGRRLRGRERPEGAAQVIQHLLGEQEVLVPEARRRLRLQFGDTGASAAWVLPARLESPKLGRHRQRGR